MHKREKGTELEEQREEERCARALRSLIEGEGKKIFAEAAGPVLHASRCAFVRGGNILSSACARTQRGV